MPIQPLRTYVCESKQVARVPQKLLKRDHMHAHNHIFMDAEDAINLIEVIFKKLVNQRNSIPTFQPIVQIQELS